MILSPSSPRPYVWTIVSKSVDGNRPAASGRASRADPHLPHSSGTSRLPRRPQSLCRLDEHTSLRRKRIGDEERNCASIVTFQNLLSRPPGKRSAPSSRGRAVTGVTLSPELPGAGVYLSVTLAWGGLSHSCRALVDSGAAGNFIDTALVQRLKIPQEALETPLSVSALDGQPIGNGKVTSATTPLRLDVGNHNENISLHLLDSPEFPVVLGFPWLNRHNPHMDWSTGSILEWGPTCHATCLFF